MAELTMPRLSDTMSEGSISRWLKQPGDKIEKGDIVAEIETDKATMELEAFESGYLTEIRVKEGQMVPIGEVIGLIGSEPGAGGNGAAAPAGSAPAPDAAVTPTADSQVETEEGADTAEGRNTQEAKAQTGQGSQPTGTADAQASAPTSTNGDGKVKASPLARKMAEDLGIDLSKVQGTGPGGRIIKENVEAFSQGRGALPKETAADTTAGEFGQNEQTPAPGEAPVATKAPTPTPAPTPAPKVAGEVVPMSRMRKAISNAMTAAKPGVPHIYVTAEVNMDAAMALRKQIAESGAGKVSVNDMVVKASAKALRAFPAINSSFAQTSDGQPGIVTHSDVHVSVAVATDNGLLAVVVRDTDKKSISTISGEVREMAGRAREGKAKQSDLEGATFQTSNLGMFDVVEFVSIITVPQAASLAVGAVREVPVVRNGEIVVGQVMNVTLSVDHRVADGAIAAQFLQEFRKLLEAPFSLLV